MTRIIQKSSKLSKKKLRGWHTEESMSSKLKWSKCLVMYTYAFFIQQQSPERFVYLNGVLALFRSSKKINPRQYIKSVVAYCRRKGNEKLVKRLVNIPLPSL